MKSAVFHSKARHAIRGFPEDLRREFGKVIFDLQKDQKLSMPLSRPMASVAQVLRSYESETGLAPIEFFITRTWLIQF